MKYEPVPSGEGTDQNSQLENAVSKARRPSWLRRKIIAGGLAAASLAGLGAGELRGQSRHVSSGEGQNVDLSERYAERFHMGAEPEAVLMAVDEDMQEGKWDEVVGTLSVLIPKLQRHQQFALDLLSHKAMPHTGPGVAERKPPDRATKGLLGKSESELAESVLTDVVYQIEIDNLGNLETWLPRFIGELQKRLDYARGLQASEAQERK